MPKERLKDANELMRTTIEPDLDILTLNAWATHRVDTKALKALIKETRKLLFYLEDAKAGLEGK